MSCPGELKNHQEESTQTPKSSCHCFPKSSKGTSVKVCTFPIIMYVYIHTLYVDVELTHVLGVQGWCSGENTHLPLVLPGFDSQTRRHMWVEFVGSLLCTERFSLGTPVSPLLKNQHLT